MFIERCFIFFHDSCQLSLKYRSYLHIFLFFCSSYTSILFIDLYEKVKPRNIKKNVDNNNLGLQQ